MKLSIIIVNYNVKYFLEQCLYSVKKAQEDFANIFGSNSSEVFVVDNNSQDDSCEMIKANFSGIKLIENKKNVGFSSANNQAIKLAKGEYILLLNPDTLVSEDTFSKVVNFIDKNNDAGGLGVHMIDGSGKFLPESKRSFPSPAVSFYKMFGLSSLFPKSEKFGKYHLSYLDKNKTHEVEVLSGAFMLLRKKTLDKSGLLDEDFFMYGEDIDMSYRVIKAGYKNYFFSETSIIHYKGESTKKGSLNYVFMFYNAMVIFAKKHFSNKKVAIFSVLIRLAVWFRAALSFSKRIFKSALLPVLDATVFYAGFYFIKPIWEAYNFNKEGYYPKEYMIYAVPVYVAFWVLSVYIAKGYKRPLDSKKLFKGILAGSFVILVFYSLLNEEFRYSRALLLLGTAWSMFFSWLLRAIFTVFKFKYFGFKKKSEKKILVVSDSDEYLRIKKLINSAENNDEKVGITPFKKYNEDNLFHLLSIEIKERKINEIIFSLKNITVDDVINIMKKLQGSSVEIKIAHHKTQSVIGSNSIHSSGELYVSDVKTIVKPVNVRIKRFSDIFFSIIFLISYPILFLLVENKVNFIKNIFKVLSGKYSWVGYAGNNTSVPKKLPEIKKGILSPVNFPIFDEKEILRINMLYARKYNLTDDIYIIYKSFDKIGNKKL
ncbi:MAG: glycosyltransferase family 2 protein [Bacteroidales bacterium]|nr:glycosyltransferase family 2 protein [Bacteroidales bacterium]